MNAAHYLKFLLAVAFTTVSGAAAALADGVLSTPETINLAIQGGGAIVTYVVPNLPTGPGRYLKLFVQGGTAAGVVAQSVLSDGITTGEWLQIAAAALGVFTVYAIPNYPELVAVGQHTDPLGAPGGSTAVYVVDGSTPAATEDGGDTSNAPAPTPFVPSASQ